MMLAGKTATTFDLANNTAYAKRSSWAGHEVQSLIAWVRATQAGDWEAFRTHAGKVAHTAAADEHNGVLLQVVADAGDVGGDFDPIGQTYPGHFTQRGVRLFRGHRTDRRADTAALRALLQNRSRGFILHLLSAFTNQLVNGRHE